MRVHSSLLASASCVGAFLALQACSFPEYTFRVAPSAGGAGASGIPAAGDGGAGLADAGSAGTSLGGSSGGTGGMASAGNGGTAAEGGGAGAPPKPKKCAEYSSLPSDCTCIDDATHAYLFCSMTRPFASAASQCSFRGMHLVKLEGPDEDAWILEQAKNIGMPSVVQYFWIGASTIKTPSVWHWQDLSVFWQGGAQGNAYPGAYYDWRTDSPQNTATESCAYTDTGGWQDGDCTQNRPYVCEAD